VKLFLALIFSLCFVPFFISIDAQESSKDVQLVDDSIKDNDTFYILAQIIHRDNDGNLITYIEDDVPVAVNLNLVDFFLKSDSKETDPIFVTDDGIRFQTVTRITYMGTDDSGLLSTIQFYLLDDQGAPKLMAQFTHDGLRLSDDEQIEVHWTFVRKV